MIPKKIYYVWGAGEAKSRLANICIENWRMMLPDYEIIEINETTKELFDFEYEYNNNLWFKTVYDLKMWAYVSDYMRVKTIHAHGGIYFDTDITVYKNFDKFLDNRMFIGNCLNNIPEMAMFGAVAGHEILKDMIDFYSDGIWKSKDYIITQIFTNIARGKYGGKYMVEPDLNKIVKSPHVTIYPPEYFNPHHYSIEFDHKCITQNTHSVHWMGSSWHSKKNLFFLSSKHKIPLKTLLKQLEFIDKVERSKNGQN